MKPYQSSSDADARIQSEFLTMVRVHPEGWLFRDVRSSGDELDGLIGYVQSDESGFEAVWMVPAPGAEHFDALEQAIEAAEGRCGERRSATPMCDQVPPSDSVRFGRGLRNALFISLPMWGGMAAMAWWIASVGRA
jgi:hypothetical protein